MSIGQDVSGLLQGDLVRVWPYARGFYPRDTLYKVWATIEAEDGHRRLFYDQECEQESERGDLETFCAMVQTVNLFLIEYQDAIGAILWIKSMPHRQGAISVWSSKACLGRPIREAALMVCYYAQECLALEHLWAYTPWTHAEKIARDCGFKPIGMLPNATVIKGFPAPIYVLQKELKHGQFL